MGANFNVCCHLCRERAFALRSYDDTGETLTRFYRKHIRCGKVNVKNLQISWDWIEEPDWTDENYGYKDVTVEVSDGYKKIVEMELATDNK